MKEVENGALAVRSRKLGDLESFAFDKLVAKLVKCGEAAIEMLTMRTIEVKLEGQRS